MQINQLLLNINSEQPDKLFAFYRDVVGLELNPQMGERALSAGGTPFLIDGHSKVQGGTKQPERVLVDFMVDDLKSEQTRLEAAGVTFVRTAGKEPWGGVISTFADPDGNFVQLIEYKP